MDHQTQSSSTSSIAPVAKRPKHTPGAASGGVSSASFAPQALGATAASASSTTTLRRPLEWSTGEYFNNGMHHKRMATHTMWRHTAKDDSAWRCANARLITLSESERDRGSAQHEVLQLIARNFEALGCMPHFEEMHCGDLKAMRAKILRLTQPVGAQALVKLGGSGGFQLRGHAQRALLPAEPYVMVRLLMELVDAEYAKIDRTDPHRFDEICCLVDPHAEERRTIPLPIQHQFFGMQSGGRWRAALDSNKAVKALWYHCRRRPTATRRRITFLPLEVYTRGFFSDPVLESLHRVLCIPRAPIVELCETEWVSCAHDDPHRCAGCSRDLGDDDVLCGGLCAATNDRNWGLFADLLSAMSGVLTHTYDAAHGDEYQNAKLKQQEDNHAAPREKTADGMVGLPDIIMCVVLA